jgi:hypothetical protein
MRLSRSVTPMLAAAGSPERWRPVWSDSTTWYPEMINFSGGKVQRDFTSVPEELITDAVPPGRCHRE